MPVEITAGQTALPRTLFMRCDGAATMYPEGSVLDIHFPEERLNDMAGDPYWIDLTVEEATAVFKALQARFDANALAPTERAIVTLS